MSTHKYFDKICCVILAIVILTTVFFMNAKKLGISEASSSMKYETTLFDSSKVHTIDIVMDNWDDFISNCKNEDYAACTVVIDHASYKNVAIRAKGNTSLTQVESYGNNRYSFKIEFDHYDSSSTYYGLDKLCLNNIIQDNTYMKDFLCYQMMNKMGVASPLCSFVYITVNGEDWGLYLAVEGVEDSFLKRNYGNESGNLYKPDSMQMPKNDMPDMSGAPFNMTPPDGFTKGKNNTPPGDFAKDSNNTPPDGFSKDGNNAPPDDFSKGDNKTFSKDFDSKNFPDKDFKFGQNNDVLLKYIDEDPDSYDNIFNSAKTDITKADKKTLIQSLKNLSENKNIEETVAIEEVIKYFVVHNFVLNFDSYTGSMIHNYYLYEKDGQMQMIPWDYNLAFGGFEARSSAEELINYPIDTPVSGSSIEERPMLSWIFADASYTELYHQYFSEFISDYFESGYFEEMIDHTINMISPYVEKDPTSFCTYEEFEKGSSTLKEFVALRAQSIRAQLEGKIGTTNDTQDSKTFIKADTIQISDMGSMKEDNKMQSKKK